MPTTHRALVMCSRLRIYSWGRPFTYVAIESPQELCSRYFTDEKTEAQRG